MAHRIQMTPEIAKLGMHAAVLLAGRKARKVEPVGEWDKASRWYPSDDEDADDYTCRIRSPSRAHPFSYVKGACTRPHVLGLAVAAPEWLTAKAKDARKAGASATQREGDNMAKGLLKLMRERADAEDREADRAEAAEYAAQVREGREAEESAAAQRDEDGAYLANIAA